MRGNLEQDSTNLMHPPVAPSAPVFKGRLAELLQAIAEQSTIMDRHWNNSDKVEQEQLPHYDYPVRAIAHYAYAVPAMNRRDELAAEAAALIAKAMQESGRGGYNFRNAKPYWIGFISGIKLYYNCDSSKFAEELREHMPEEVQWVARSIAYMVSAILRER